MRNIFKLSNGPVRSIKIDPINSVEWLYLIALILHFTWLYWYVVSEPIAFVNDFGRLMVNLYEAIGFKWGVQGTALISAGMLSAIIVNILRRIIECILLGWPRFSAHDVSTARAFILRAVGYGLLCFIGLGAWGANETEHYAKLSSVGVHSIYTNFLHIAIISTGTFLFGCVVNVLDDAISALIINHLKRS